MKRLKLCLPVGLLLAWALCLGAQDGALAVDAIGGQDASAMKEIRAILLARSGFLWIGSRAGLSRYDGYRVVPFRSPGGDPAPAVRSLCEDAQGRIWLATSSGLLYNDPTRRVMSHFRREREDRDTIGSDDLTCVHISSALPGTLWIASADGTLDALDLDSSRVRRLLPAAADSPPTGAIHAIHGDATGVLWLGAARGLFHFHPQDNQLRVDPLPPLDPTRLEPVAIRSLLGDGGGGESLWLGSETAGLLRFLPAPGAWQRCREPGVSQAAPAAGSAISAIAPFPGAPQDLMLGTSDGLYRFETASGLCRRLPMLIGEKALQTFPAVDLIHRDPQGIYWIGTRDLGLFKWSPLRKEFHHHVPFSGEHGHQQGLTSWVTSLRELAGGEILLTTYGGGVLLFDRQGQSFQPLLLDPARPGRRLNSLVSHSLIDANGDLWFATAEGLARCTSAGRLQRLYPIATDEAEAAALQVFLFIQDRRKMFWIGTDRGLVRLDPRDGSLRRYRHDPRDPRSLAHDRVNALLEAADGSVWAGGPGGLGLCRPGEDRISVFRSDPADALSLACDQVNALVRDSQGRIWVCTANGLDRMEREQGRLVFRHFRAASAAANQNTFHSLLEEAPGRFWSGTSAGLARFDGENGRFTLYDDRDGVEASGMSAAHAFLRCRDGEIFFGSHKGFIRFHPQKIALNRHPPPLVSTGFRVFGSREEMEATDLFPFAGEPGYAAGKKIVRVEFAALDFVRPEKNQYAYRLEGRDRDWIYQGTRRVVDLEGLAVGSYSLLVKAANNEGLWNETAISMPIHVRPSFWERWRVPFLAALLLAAAAGILAVGRRRRRRLRQAAIPGNLDRVLEKYAISKREGEIVRLLMAGRSNKQIEDELYIAMATVKIHVHNIYRKVRVHGRLQLVLRLQQEAKKLG